MDGNLEKRESQDMTGNDLSSKVFVKIKINKIFL